MDEDHKTSGKLNDALWVIVPAILIGVIFALAITREEPKDETINF